MHSRAVKTYSTESRCWLLSPPDTSSVANLQIVSGCEDFSAVVLVVYGVCVGRYRASSISHRGSCFRRIATSLQNVVRCDGLCWWRGSRRLSISLANNLGRLIRGQLMAEKAKNVGIFTQNDLLYAVLITVFTFALAMVGHR
jgi:hypothetical protein